MRQRLRFAVFVLGFASLMSGRGATAQEVPGEMKSAASVGPAADGAMIDLRQKLMYYRSSGFSLDVYQEGRKLDLGLSGAHYASYFGESPEALAVAESGRRLRIGGVATYVVGIAILAADLGILLGSILANDTRFVTTEQPVIYGLLISGGILGFVGGSIISAGQRRMVDAVSIFNWHLINKNLPPALRFQYGLAPLVGSPSQGTGMMASLGGRF